MNTAMKEKLKKLYSGTVSLALVVCLVFSSLGFFMSSTHASETPPAKITALLYSGDTMPNGEPETDSAMLFKTYVSAHRNPNDDITLVMNASQPFEISDNAVQIGSDAYPFNGILRLNSISDAAFTTSKAIFGYISTDAQILTESGAAYNGSFEITRVVAENDLCLNSALFADHIVLGSTKDTLTVNVTCLNDGESHLTYAGVIGTIGAGAKVDLTFVNNGTDSGSVSSIYSDGNVGLVCGTMGAGAELSLDLSGTLTSYAVTSNSGAAGGLVGVMLSGSKLTLLSSYTDVAAVTANGVAYVAPETPGGYGAPGEASAEFEAPAKSGGTPDAEGGKTEAKSEDKTAPTDGDKAEATDADKAETKGEDKTEAAAGDKTEATAGEDKTEATDGEKTSPAATDAPETGDKTETPASDETPAESDKAPATDEAPAEGDQTPAADETPAEGDKTPAVDETPAESDKTPATDETPAEGDKAPTADETPAEGEKAPAADETHAESDKTPATDETSAESDKTPATDEAPAEGDKAPATDETSAESDKTPAADETPAEGDKAPATDEAPAEGDKTPATDETPAEDDKTPATDEAPAEGDKTPATDETPAEGDKTPASDEPPAEGDKTPATDETPSNENKTDVTDGDKTSPAISDSPVTGDKAETTGSDKTEAAAGDKTETASGDKTEAAAGDKTEAGSNDKTETASGDKDTEKGDAKETDKDKDSEKGEIKEAAPAEGDVKNAPAVGGAKGPMRTVSPGTFPVIDTGTLKSGYAGGIVGWAEDAVIELDASVTVTVSGTVVGSVCAGGVFGYYRAGDDHDFELDDYTVTATLGSALYTSANVGGVFAKLDSGADVSVTDDTYKPAAGTKDSFNISPTFVHGANGGGIIGLYSADALSQTLLIKDLKAYVVNVGSVTRRGGIIGKIDDVPAYVELRSVGAKGSSLNGGLVGTAGSGGSFINVCEYAGLQGYVASSGGGLVGYLNNGVLRLQGETRMQDDSRFTGGMTSQSGGQLVGQRGDGFVYAVGTGADASTIDNAAGTGWAFYRVNGSRRDDIHDWGEVVRFGGSPLALNSGVITEDLSAHTVTIAAAVTSMATVQDFARTALNIQQNVSGMPASGALRFAGAQNSAALLSASLSITADIDLSGTGITGLARDNGANNSFTGSFDGNGHSISLATGEIYGLEKSGSAAAESANERGAGRIYNHRYLGLFAETASSANIEDLTVDGFISLLVPNPGSEATWNVGGISAYHAGTLTLDGCSTAETITFATGGDKVIMNVGGAIGLIGDAAGTVTVSGGTYGAELVEKRFDGIGRVYSGGIVGTVDPSTSNQINFVFSGLTLEGSFENSAASSTYLTRFGGLIGIIKANGANTVKRAVTVRNVTVAGLDVDVTTNEAAGGVLGYEWLGTDVTIGTAGQSDGLVLGTAGNDAISPHIKLTPNSGSTRAMMGGLAFGASGHWIINDLKVNNATFETAGANVDFGFVAAEGVVSSSALYLEVAGSMTAHYDLSGVKVAGSGFNLFDEVVTYTVQAGSSSTGSISFTPKAITENGAAIISLRTTDGNAVNMTGSACNTYQNQTAYGKANAAKSIHDHSRYYYNLDTIRAKGSPTAAEKLLLWSLNKYAHSTVQSYFTNHLGSTLTGSFDMTGLSYYPVTASGVTISSATIKFYNEQIEGGELVAGGDGLVRSTRTDTQHEYMHCGLLYNTEDLTVTNVTVKGTVGSEADGSGFLVRGTLWNSTGNYTDITGVTLDNALVRSGATAAGTASGYAPLLINKAGNNDLDKPTNLTLTTVSTANYASAAVAASSLIGNVSGTDIQLTFSDMRLDARTGLLGTAADAVLAEKYGTTQSIFTTATLLNSFTHTDASSEGRYNFSLAEDWSGSTAVHHVAYGKEISGSVEYAAVTQDEYFDQAVKINPASSSGGAYNFNTSSWLPYVAAGYDAGSHTHELRINQKLASFSEGCGKCDDPYIITDGDQLVSVASIIRGDPVDTTFELVLPDSLTPNTVHTASGTGSKANDATYSYNDSLDKFTSDTAGTPQYTVAAVREYLAGAYYSISQDITIPDTGFTGLGAVNTDYTDYLCPYAFRGVILGNTHTITNQTSSPLIANSNGAVVKQLRVTVQKAYTVAKNNETDNTTLTFRYSGGMDTYGALIGKVMGGDTFIDNVNVTFDISAGSISASGTAARLVPVGSYIGVVVNGGVIFRNMPANAGSAFGTYCTAVSNSGWLYANPVIGRVIAGYAFSEDNAVDNGSKNYEIPVLDKNNANKLTMSTSSAVSVPDGQAVWVLGAIINSGAGAASGYNKVYPSDKSVWSAYRNYTAARSGASDYADCVYNAPTTKKAYIVQQYTTGNYVRAIGGLSGLTVTLTGNCTVPKGFRGIGGFYKDDNSLRLSINEFNGGNYTVTLDVRFLEYVDSSAKLFENYRAIAGCAGLGLFNTIGTGGTGAAAASLHNLTIAGSIYYDVKDTSGNTTYAWNNYESGQGVNLRSLSTGGLVGYIVDRNFRIRNIKLDGLTVEGARYAGGVVGRISTSKSGFSGEISQCGTGESGGAVTVRGGFSAGGLVGRLFAIKRGIYTFVCDGDLDDADPLSIRSSGKSLMKINEVRSLGTVGDSETYRNFAFSAGGLYGFVQSSNNQTTVNGSPTGGGVTFTFSDFEVRGGTVACNYAYSNNRNDNGRSGGVIGTLAHSNSDISGIKVKNVNVDGFYAGGLVGKSQTGWLFESRAFSDIVIDGSPAGEGSDALIDGDTSAGGIFGFFEIHDNTTTEELQITDCHVSHYTIGSTKRSLTTRTTKNYYTGLNAAGGIFGDFFLHAEETVNFANLSVKDCTIFISSLNSNYTSTANLHGAGGIAGLFQPQTATTTRVITGHNIVVTNTAVENRKYASESATEYTVVKNFCGTLFGWNGDGSTKFTGVTAYGTTMSADGSYAPVGYRSGSNDYGPEGYVIFADHEGVSVSNSANTSDNMLFTSGDLTADDPYVTVNPGFAIDSAGHLLTGDGMVAATLRKLLTAADSRYDHALAKSGILTGATLTDRLSTYKTEFGITGDSGPDVTFLVINASESHADVTGAINSCLNLLSNTQYDFTDLSDTADICTVTVKRMVRSGGNFILSGSDDASVFVDNLNHRFSVRKGLVDNNRDSFTLIDVAFLDPYEPTDVAYHLYLPVFVKKVLEFEFTSYVMPDTTYRAADYAGHKQVLENFGTPVTLCFTYTYARSTSEWITALSIGDNLLGNYNKSITLTKYGSVDPLPAGTRLVLVDAQTGRPYYMTLGANFSGALDLADFVAADGTTHFEPVSISGRLNVSAGLDPLGEAPFMRCPENDANVLVQATDGYFYRLYTEEDGEQDRYSLSTSVSNLSETYYLSVFTDVDDTGIARYTVDCPTHLSDSYPTTCISGDTPRRSDLILGQVYTMSISSFTTSGGDSENVLDRTNDSITANMEASVRLNNGSIYSAFVGSIYHSFLVHLTRTDAEGSRTAIVGEPTVSGTYSIDGGAATAYRNGSDDEWTASGGYARFTATQNLNGSLTNPAKNYTATISATVTIDYNSNESSIEEQFPAKPADTMSDTTTGTTVFVKSNIASSPERTEYSSTSIRADDGLANRYFSKPMNKEAQLSYNTVSHSFIYDLAELGINPLDEDNETSSLVETVAVLDFGAAKDQSAGYTHLKLSMSLAQKNDGYTAELDLSEYFDSLTIAGASVTLTGNAIEILLPKTKTGYPGLTFSADGYQATIPINFYVKTGAALESAGKYYSNYKVTLDVDLVKVEGNNEILLVNANPNYIIYTNARILPDFIG